jgi:hypothetical protein
MKRIRQAALGLAAIWVWSASAYAETLQSDMMKQIKLPLSSRVMIQKVAKDYLYIGNEVAVTQARKEMSASFKTFDAKQKKLADSLNDPKIKNLMMFIQMNVDEIRDTIKQPYSLDNAAVVVDLAEAISEGELKIADILKKKLTGKTPTFMGQRYDITQIAKYYIAYQGGLKDDVTVRQMNQSVTRLQRVSKEMAAYPENTPEMNRIMNRIEKQWRIVHQFYLDIEEGGLPLIVYQTTSSIEKQLHRYAKALIKLKAQKGK